MVSFAPIILGSVAGLEAHGDILIDGPFEAGVGKVHEVVAKVVAVVPGEMDGGESPGKPEIEAGKDLRNDGIGKKCVGVEIRRETGFFAGAPVREEEVAGADFDLLQFLVAVLNGKDVVVVGRDGGAGERFVFDVGFDDVFVAGKLTLAVHIDLGSIVKEAEPF